MGVVVQPVSHSVLKASVARGANVKRVVLERIKVDPPPAVRATKRAPRAEGEWRILIFLNGHTDGITPALYRGGVRTFRTMEKVEKYGRELMPMISVESYDCFLRKIWDEPGVLPATADESGEPPLPPPRSLAA